MKKEKKREKYEIKERYTNMKKKNNKVYAITCEDIKEGKKTTFSFEEERCFIER